MRPPTSPCAYALAALFLCAGSVSAAARGTGARTASLRILTVNVWSGLDYRGTFRFGEYESSERRERRCALLLEGLRTLDPDVIFLQEANPVPVLAGRLADRLGYDQIHQVCMGGVKIGSLGIPTNFREGIAILARPGLRLRKTGTWKLSGGPGLHGDALTFQFTEACFALAATVSVDERPVYLVNTHLHSAPQNDPAPLQQFEEDLRSGAITAAERDDALRTWREGMALQAEQLGILRRHLEDLPRDVPVILGGDLNMPPGRDTLAGFRTAAGFVDACGPAGFPTWDPAGNENARYSLSLTDATGDPLDAYGRLDAYANTLPARIDHILLSRHFPPGAVRSSGVVLDSAVSGLHASDHYGVAAEIDLLEALSAVRSDRLADETTTEPLPILSYDTDTGFGYGLKLFALNHLRSRESFDLVVFNSSKGERWYRFVFSVPDPEVRQGAPYPLALDLTVDYDKWIRNSFFGTGNRTGFSRREIYTREPLDLTVTASRGFSGVFVAQAGLRYLTVRNSAYADTSALLVQASPLSAGRATASSVFASARYDSRNSVVNPTTGLVLQAEVEYAPRWSWTNVSYTRAGVLAQFYAELFYPTTVFAGRLWFQGMIGRDLPVQMLLPVGGNRTLRGFVQDRYLDRIAAVANFEIRFPIVWRFGGIAGYDLGSVWNRPGEVGLKRWAVNPAAGLRFVFDTFVVRLDLGFGPETTGFYLNFGHLF